MSKLDSMELRASRQLPPQGYLFSAVAAGIKKKDREDLGLIYSRVPAACAGVFTTNQVKAAPVLLAKERLAQSRGRARAILVNSGCANACTGPRGYIAAGLTSSFVADALGIDESLVLPSSTGVIGSHLPANTIRKKVPALVKGLNERGFFNVACAMMTTDTFPKVLTAWGRIRGRIFRVMGLAKGAGMIAPNMATMLAFVLTDAAATSALLDEILEDAVTESFNLVTVDGDTSTNDTCLILANGQAGTEELNVRSGQRAVEPLRNAIFRVTSGLAEMIARDGEGATRLVRVRVRRATTPAAAEAAAKAIANSPLVKTAIFGRDPNWGRIMAALGRAGVEFDPNMVDIYIGRLKIVREGQGRGQATERKAAKLMEEDEVIITVDLGQGPAGVEVLTCDLSHDYISINADYRT